ncbi:male development gene 1, putative [Plasmodium relictum]|uniref:Male development gene 1, putative n=1 Tax=Plasmodium relictum TaxID=85471 RepID=A0A1J1HEV5_PLARL|nr:male development gene 1, putative [Plasmodium relictum]CRH02594.1 male development gene 1, putative [Plasmodium relictum]
MKHFKISTLNIFGFFFLYLSFQNAYKCMKIGSVLNKRNNNSIKLGGNDGNSAQWSNKGNNFMELLKDKYSKSKRNIDDMKDELADELANKIQNKIEDYLKEESNLSDTENITGEDLNELKTYVRDISEYVGMKAADLLDRNLEEALKPILPKKEYDNFKNTLDDSSEDNLEHANEVPKHGNINEETETFVDELVDEYENEQFDVLNPNEKEIKTHNNLD